VIDLVGEIRNAQRRAEGIMREMRQAADQATLFANRAEEASTEAQKWLEKQSMGRLINARTAAESHAKAAEAGLERVREVLRQVERIPGIPRTDTAAAGASAEAAAPAGPAKAAASQEEGHLNREVEDLLSRMQAVLTASERLKQQAEGDARNIAAAKSHAQQHVQSIAHLVKFVAGSLKGIQGAVLAAEQYAQNARKAANAARRVVIEACSPQVGEADHPSDAAAADQERSPGKAEPQGNE
jgi:hypothetical protein